MLEAIAGFGEDVFNYVSGALFVFGLPLSAIIVVITLIQTVYEKRWQALFLMALIVAAIGLTIVTLGSEFAFCLAALLTIAMSIYVLVFATRSALTWLATLTVSACAIGSLMFHLPPLIDPLATEPGYLYSNFLAFLFSNFVHAILARLSRRVFMVKSVVPISS